MDDPARGRGIGRRQLLHAGFGVAGGLILAGRANPAVSQPPLGTWPSRGQG